MIVYIVMSSDSILFLPAISFYVVWGKGCPEKIKEHDLKSGRKKPRKKRVNVLSHPDCILPE